MEFKSKIEASVSRQNLALFMGALSLGLDTHTSERWPRVTKAPDE
jgi:hypothetical protein